MDTYMDTTGPKADTRLHLENDGLVFDARREAVPLGRRVVLQKVPAHTAEDDPLIKSRLASIKLTSEPYVVQIGSRNSSSLWQRVPRSPRCGWSPRRSARSTCPHVGGRLFQSNVNMSP